MSVVKIKIMSVKLNDNKVKMHPLRGATMKKKRSESLFSKTTNGKCNNNVFGIFIINMLS